MKGLLTAAGLFPHPPIMVPEIGGKETKKIQQTMDAVRKSMKLIMETDPETVVVMSPHNLCLPSGPAIFIKENLAGDLMYFGHPEVSMEFSVDQELAEAVMKEAEPVIPLFRMDEAAAKKFGRKIEIDWGMFVPMYFLKKAAFKGNVLLFSPCFTNYDMNKVLGEIVTNCAEKLGRRIAIVASGDLSHRLTKDSPNGYSPDGIVFDRGVMKALEGKTMEPLLTMTDDFIERIGMCGRSISSSARSPARNGPSPSSRTKAPSASATASASACPRKPMGEKKPMISACVWPGTRLPST